ncbi:MAG: sulfur transferase domain-containing protein, partial [Paracoccaceae bacterium]|nr:sulfur transferase domain-containing protein [Paracoccaceae bacterium]
MDLRPLTPTYAVSPQIELSDLPAIKAAGYYTVIDNRPDSEISAHLQTIHMRVAAEGLGLTFIANPIVGGSITMQNVTDQG